MHINKSKYLSCSLCPHNCKANRINNNLGFCKTGTAYFIASICAHKGEEPVISGDMGICNVFFNHCNMQCVYCQNFQISLNNKNNSSSFSEENTITTITNLLDSGCPALGFVSPSHCIVQMADIIKKVNEKGYKPVVIYNSNGYDKVDTLGMIEKLVDVYLPDFKYADDDLAFKLSGIRDYSSTAVKAISEMITQKGAGLELNENEVAIKGIIIRHLVLPHFIENSKRVLQLIADNFGNEVHISLMSQYYPTTQVKDISELNYTLDSGLFDEVIDFMDNLGFENGWIQELDSKDNYRPDFSKEHPFEN